MLWNSKFPSAARNFGFALGPKSSIDQVELLILQPVCGLQELSVIRRLPEFRHLQPDLPVLESVPVQASVISSQTVSTMQVCGDRFTLILVMPCSATS